MNYWLVKTEPESFGYHDLERLGLDRWNGVKNWRALSNIKKISPGDLIFVYHTGKEKAIIGVAEAISPAYPDPALNDPKLVVFDLVPKYRLERPVTLSEVKADPQFNQWELVRLPRLSVMPVPAAYWESVHRMAEIKPGLHREPSLI